jgi:hypothetical protein
MVLPVSVTHTHTHTTPPGRGSWPPYTFPTFWFWWFSAVFPGIRGDHPCRNSKNAVFPDPCQLFIKISFGITVPRKIKYNMGFGTSLLRKIPYKMGFGIKVLCNKKWSKRGFREPISATRRAQCQKLSKRALREPISVTRRAQGQKWSKRALREPISATRRAQGQKWSKRTLGGPEGSFGGPLVVLWVPVGS